MRQVAVRLLMMLAFTSLIFASVWLFVFFLPYEFKLNREYDVLVDVLTIVLAIVSVVITAFGVGTYVILSRAIQERAESIVSRRAEEILASENVEHLLRQAALAREMAYQKWMEWKDLPEGLKKIRQYLLERAIYLTKVQHEDVRERLANAKYVSEEKQLEFQGLYWELKNDLAYYLAERGRQADTAEAQALGQELLTKARSFSLPDYNWLETCAWVFKKLPLTPADIGRSREIINDMLQRADIDSEWKEETKRRYLKDP